MYRKYMSSKNTISRVFISIKYSSYLDRMLFDLPSIIAERRRKEWENMYPEMFNKKKPGDDRAFFHADPGDHLRRVIFTVLENSPLFTV